MTPLAGIELIITRPLVQAKSWARQAAALGAETRLLPVLEIAPVGDEKRKTKLRQQILALADYDKAIFVSQNAVHQAMEWIDQLWPQFPPLDYFAIGSATARAARDWGLNVIAGDDAMNSEALLEVPGLQSVRDQKILIFRGVGGRPLLAEQLRRRGARVDYCELYHRRFPAEAEQQWREFELAADKQVVLSTHSSESLENLDHLLMLTGRQNLKASPLLVPGPRVAAAAKKLGFSRVIEAENATDQAMLRALREWVATLS